MLVRSLRSSLAGASTPLAAWDSMPSPPILTVARIASDSGSYDSGPESVGFGCKRHDPRLTPMPRLPQVARPHVLKIAYATAVCSDRESVRHNRRRRAR